jgi:hypothetical protein
MNQTDDIMRKYFEQRFVYLRNVRLATDNITKLALHRRERRLRITALARIRTRRVRSKSCSN